MRPMNVTKALPSALFAAIALVLSAPAGAGNAPAQAPQTIGGDTASPAADTSKPAWLRALEARSKAMNEYYRDSAATAARRDDRAVHRPLSRAALVADSSADDPVAWCDFGLGLLGGHGVGLLLAGGLLFAEHRRGGDRVALP